jgi:outer membrane lipoprotein SlyB
VDTNLRDGSDVNEEGQFKGSGHDRWDTRETAIGGGAGLVMGALIGGAEGGLIGAGVGAGATMAHWLYKRRTATLAAGTILIFEISRPTIVGSSSTYTGAE